MTAEICGDSRFEIIDKAKKHLLEATNIDTSKEEMAVLDSFLFRCWQMGWLDKYDTSEPSGDLIRRADAIEAVRKKLQDWGAYAFEDYRRGLYEAQDIIDALPSADIIRCEDCQHYGMGNCYMYGGQMNEDDYCSRASAKMKED